MERKRISMRSLVILFTFLLSFIWINNTSGKSNFSENTFKYALSLQKKKDYYRSITEFKRYLFFGKDKTKQEQAQYNIGLNYLKAQDYQKAQNTFYDICDQSKHSKREPALLGIADSYYYKQAKNIKQIDHYHFFPLHFSTDYYTEFLKEYPIGSDYYEEGYVQLIKMNILNLNQFNTFYLINNSPVKKEKYKKQIKRLTKKAEEIDEISEKSKTAATLFSILLPGMGQVYAGDVQDGFIALAVNIITGFTAYYTYVNYSKFLGIFIGYYEFTFYLGNINNAQLAVEKYNENQKNLFRQDVIQINF